MSCGCIDQIDMCITRGASFSLDIGFAMGWEEVIAAPDQFTVNVVWRRKQLDSSPELLRKELVIVPQPDAITIVGEPQAIAALRLTPTETSGFPTSPRRIVAYCDVFDTVGQSVRRLFNADVRLED
jgi:hypothetical protein